MSKTTFDNVQKNLSDLLKDVRNGWIGLPDLQRPFVWRDNKVRDLFDSMMKGFPRLGCRHGMAPGALQKCGISRCLASSAPSWRCGS